MHNARRKAAVQFGFQQQTIEPMRKAMTKGMTQGKAGTAQAIGAHRRSGRR